MPSYPAQPLGTSGRVKDRATFVEAWKNHVDRLRSLCVRWVGGDREDAEEVLGRVALRAMEDMASRQEVILNYPAWLVRLAWNTSMDLHREKASHRRAVERWVEERGHEGEGRVESAESERLRAELAAWLEAALERLPPKLRDASRLRFVDEASYDDIAAQLGTTNESVRKRIQEARALLARSVAVYQAR